MAPMLRTVVALILAFVSFGTVTAQDNPIPLVCQEGVQIIAMVGTNVANGSQSYGLTVTFVQHVMAAIPNSANISINYDRFPNGVTNCTEFGKEVDRGVGALATALESYVAACPNTPIVIHGYSEGAVAVGNLLCGGSSICFPSTAPLNSSYADHIIAVVLYGDETRTAGQPYNLGGCNASSPYFPRKKPQGCAAFAPSMQSYCFADDTDCCSTANGSTALYPYGIAWHYLYPSGYDNDATDFVVSKYDNFMNRTSSTSTTASSTKTTSSSTKLSSSTKTTTTSSSSKTSSSTTKPSSTTTTATSSTKTTTSTSSSTITSTSTTPLSTTAPPTPTTSSIGTVTTIITASSTTIATTLLCTTDKCLSSFGGHPTKASNLCDSITSGLTPQATPWPKVCTGDWASRASSACECLAAVTVPVTA